MGTKEIQVIRGSVVKQVLENIKLFQSTTRMFRFS